MPLRQLLWVGMGPTLALGLLAGCGGQAENQAAGNAPAQNAPAPGSHAGHTMDHSQMPSMARLQEASGEAFDAAFLSEMIEHHQGALEMSEKYLPEGKRAGVKDTAKKIIADQQKEIAQMTAWTKEWTGKQPDPELRQLMKTDMASMMTAFERECRADCDRAFLTHMKMHHQMAVAMAKMAQEKATHPQLKDLAGKIIESQSREMEQFGAWLKEWYPEAASTPPAGH
jgi:uncharacterized protein (DUF305 family)